MVASHLLAWLHYVAANLQRAPFSRDLSPLLQRKPSGNITQMHVISAGRLDADVNVGLSAECLDRREMPARLGLFPLVPVSIPVNAYVNAAPSSLPHCLGQEDGSAYVDNRSTSKPTASRNTEV